MILIELARSNNEPQRLSLTRCDGFAADLDSLKFVRANVGSSVITCESVARSVPLFRIIPIDYCFYIVRKLIYLLHCRYKS